MWHYFSLILIVAFSFSTVKSEVDDYYTSVVGLENLVNTEWYMLENFENYLLELEKKNKEVHKFLNEVEELVDEAELDPESFYGNPINAYKTIKRLVYDWKDLEGLVFKPNIAEVYVQNLTKIQQNLQLPTNEDIQGAAKGMARLQSTYDLKTSDVANGELMDIVYSPELTADDCYIMGRSLYEVEQYKYSTEWLIEAKSRMQKQTENRTDDTAVHLNNIGNLHIFEYLAPAFFYLNNFKMALKLNEELLTIDPTHENALTNKEVFESKIREIRLVGPRSQLHSAPTTTTVAVSEVQQLYEAVCREELVQTPAKKRKLRCRYVTNKVPFCLIAPFKMEELNHDPYVAHYYDVIYDSEMEQIIDSSEQNVVRSRVGGRLENSVYSDIRTSKNTWLYYEHNAFLKPISQRLADITGLSLGSAEPLQVANYGIGGHYGPHHDFSEVPDETYPGKGNRILTALFYINEVELGGGTAFPHLHLAVPPIKGSLVIWYNMHDSLELDYRTLHAGCPVLKGSKWICNEWFHAIGQEFKRCCGLKTRSHKSLAYKNKY